MSCHYMRYENMSYYNGCSYDIKIKTSSMDAPTETQLRSKEYKNIDYDTTYYIFEDQTMDNTWVYYGSFYVEYEEKEEPIIEEPIVEVPVQEPIVEEPIPTTPEPIQNTPVAQPVEDIVSSVMDVVTSNMNSEILSSSEYSSLSTISEQSSSIVLEKAEVESNYILIGAVVTTLIVGSVILWLSYGKEFYLNFKNKNK